VQPPHVVLVHGEKTEMMRLKGALEKSAVEKGIARTVYTPAINQTVKVRRVAATAVDLHLAMDGHGRCSTCLSSK